MKNKELLNKLNVMEMRLVDGSHMLVQFLDDTDEFIKVNNPILIKSSSTADPDSGEFSDYRYYIHAMPMSIETEFVIYKDQIIMCGTAALDTKDLYVDIITTIPKGPNPLPEDNGDLLDSDDANPPTFH